MPCFLWIFAGAPHVERLRGIAWIARAMGAITAAVVGVIANLALWFALHVLFGTFSKIELGPAILSVPAAMEPNWPAVAIAAGAAVMLLGLKWNLFAVLGTSAAAGMAFRLLG